MLQTLKIATWNLERPKIPKSGYSLKNQGIIEILQNINADILVLSETNSIINPGPDYIACISSKALPVNEIFEGCNYNPGENRTTIWSKFPVVNQITTSNDFTNVCADLDSPFGIIRVYGAIIGIQGQKNPWFMDDLKNTIDDCEKLSKNFHFVLAGDFNISFSDNYYPHKAGKEIFQSLFTAKGLLNHTAAVPENIDHIVISNPLSTKFNTKPLIEWMASKDKTLSDHKWVSVVFHNPN